MPLHIACRRGHIEIVKMLIENRANPHVKDNFNCTPLCVACLHGKIEVVKILLKYQPNLNRQDSRYGNTPLHCACAQNYPEIAMLLIKNGANTHIKNYEGLTPLDYIQDN